MAGDMSVYHEKEKPKVVMKTTMEEKMRFTAKIPAEMRMQTGEGYIRPEHDEVGWNYTKTDSVRVGFESWPLEAVVRLDQKNLIAIETRQAYLVKKTGDGWNLLSEYPLGGKGYIFGCAVKKDNRIMIFNDRQSDHVVSIDAGGNWQEKKFEEHPELKKIDQFIGMAKYNILVKDGKSVIENVKRLRNWLRKKENRSLLTDMDMIPGRTTSMPSICRNEQYSIITNRRLITVMNMIDKKYFSGVMDLEIKEVFLVGRDKVGLLCGSRKSEFVQLDITSRTKKLPTTGKFIDFEECYEAGTPDFNSAVIMDDELIVCDCVASLTGWCHKRDEPYMTSSYFLGYGWSGNMVKISDTEFCVNFGKVGHGLTNYLYFFEKL